MIEKPPFLEQSDEDRQKDLERQRKRRAKAEAAGLVLSKTERQRDHLDRCIRETRDLIKSYSGPHGGKADLKRRLKFYKEERAKLGK